MTIEDKINELKKFITKVDNLKDVESLYPEGCAVYWKYVDEIHEELKKDSKYRSAYNTKILLRKNKRKRK